MPLQWYIVHVYSGFENKVRKSLEERIIQSGTQAKFGRILVPTEQIVELVKGRRRTSSRKFWPGYILVEMELDDQTWHTVTGTDKVSGFLGAREKPIPITEAEAQKILSRMEDGQNRPKPRHLFEPGDEIRVTDGPFTSFTGVVEHVSPEKGKIRVLVTIFGRATPVELEFVQVTKI